MCTIVAMPKKSGEVKTKKTPTTIQYYRVHSLYILCSDAKTCVAYLENRVYKSNVIVFLFFFALLNRGISQSFLLQHYVTACID